MGIGDFRPVLHETSSARSCPTARSPTTPAWRWGGSGATSRSSGSSIHDSLERFLRAHREDGILQEEFVTIRNERFVVPIVPAASSAIDGVIHGASGSGHTLFVEPLDTIELNNELVRLDEEEMREVHRILREMTERLREHAPRHCRRRSRSLGELELLFAKARFALDFDCVDPALQPAECARLMLREARHPLLEDVLRRQRKTGGAGHRSRWTKRTARC